VIDTSSPPKWRTTMAKYYGNGRERLSGFSCDSIGAFFQSRAILTTRNDTVTEVNDWYPGKNDGRNQIYEAIDSVDTGEGETTNPIEFLRAQNPSSLPPAKLKLKIGAPIILRNLFPQKASATAPGW
jgi:hypothetical protein